MDCRSYRFQSIEDAVTVEKEGLFRDDESCYKCSNSSAANMLKDACQKDML